LLAYCLPGLNERIQNPENGCLNFELTYFSWVNCVSSSRVHAFPYHHFRYINFVCLFEIFHFYELVNVQCLTSFIPIEHDVYCNLFSWIVVCTFLSFLDVVDISKFSIHDPTWLPYYIHVTYFS